MIQKQSAKVSKGVVQTRRPPKILISKAKGKDNANFFFDSKGVIHHEYVPEDQTVNAMFYVQVWYRLCTCIARVRSEMWRDRMFFLLHDNAHPHIAAIFQQFLAKKGVTQLSHPPYLPNLSPLPDYFAFPKLKLELKGAHFASIEDIQKSVTTKL